ncbi:organic hydroperoxide resistance protein [Puniceibacterium sp. IMCC21224]|uniref:organic hydroperoxide resistance protein n=1 Tax=Puniceibacterium sp. IMCC21224 TaxID=1618204 RepID=UPI00064E075F|nr:organic hydroperoxide resistance protein [Puniceibacterium sp. IMCC21224]KMK65673.1 peroxiredoxin, Ohr subfamily [Puniceibacterium sp. IMCC21224]
MPTKIIYSTSATATGGGRDGHTQTDDGTLSLDLAVPTAMGGPGGDAANPEKLFAAGYAACFMGAMRFYAGQKKLSVPDDASVNVQVGIGPREDMGFGLDIQIKVSLPGVDEATAKDLIDGGHGVCPYSNAITKGLTITPVLA